MLEPQPELLNPSEISKDKYLKRLPEVDKTNLSRLISTFEDVMKTQKRGGSLVVVGGTINKDPLPRKDVDVLMVLEPDERDKPRDTANKETELSFAIRDFDIFRRIASQMSDALGFIITKEIEPYPDIQFQNDNILDHDGALTLLPPEGMPIEIVRIRERGPYQNIVRNDKRPYVPISVVSQVEKAAV